jgi:hypothetical protein
LAASFSSHNGVPRPEIGAADSLALAIGELREELLSWIDAELSRLQELQREEDRSMEVMSGVPGSWPDDRDSSQGVDESCIAVRGPGMNLELGSTPCDPGERLDALVRRLDHRLKQAAGATKRFPDPGADRGNDIREEPRHTPSSRTVGWSSTGDSTVDRGR